jgi:hypothetical protein
VLAWARKKPAADVAAGFHQEAYSKEFFVQLSVS